MFTGYDTGYGYDVVHHRPGEAPSLKSALMTGQVEKVTGIRRCFAGEGSQYHSLAFLLRSFHDRWVREE